MVPCAGLDDVAAAVRAATADIEHPLEARPGLPAQKAARAFLGHLTIARMKNSRRCPASGFALAATFTVSEVHLVRSHLARRGCPL